MKKYWIKDLTEWQVIHAPTKEIAKKLCKRFDMLGLQWSSGDPYSVYFHWDKYKEETCYRPYKGAFCGLSLATQQYYEILTIEQLLDFQANEYPRVMEVSYDGKNWRKRVVFMKKNGKFLAWGNVETIEEAENSCLVCTWKFAREIQPAPALELTLDEIADKFGISVDRLKIKK